MLLHQSHTVQHLHHLLVVFRLVPEALDPKALLDNVLYRHTGIKGVHRILEDHLDLIQQLSAHMGIVIFDLLDLLLLCRLGGGDVCLDLSYGFIRLRLQPLMRTPL